MKTEKLLSRMILTKRMWQSIMEPENHLIHRNRIYRSEELDIIKILHVWQHMLQWTNPYASPALRREILKKDDHETKATIKANHEKQTYNKYNFFRMRQPASLRRFLKCTRSSETLWILGESQEWFTQAFPAVRVCASWPCLSVLDYCLSCESGSLCPDSKISVFADSAWLKYWHSLDKL